MHAITYSDGSVVYSPVIQIWEDLHNERAGFYRAFWCESPEAGSGSPVIGYCSPGGSHRTIKAVVQEAKGLWSVPKETKFYRNGKEVRS